MASRPAIALVMIAAACGCAERGAQSARERLLAQLPGDAVSAVVADGTALASPRIRAVIDVLAAQWPSSMDCVIEAALAGDQVAASVDGRHDVLVAIATATAPSCPALSQRAPGLWVATIGAGPAAGPTTLLDDPRFARARPYLTTAPIALVSLDGVHAIATAQPDPIDAWLVIDSPGGSAGAEAITAAWSAALGRLRADRANPAAAAVAARVQVARSDGQVTVRLAGGGGGGELDLAAAVRSALANDPPHDAACPGGSCAPMGRQVGSLSAALPLVVTAGRPSLAVSDGAVTGLRLTAAVGELGLDAGDVVVAVAGRLVESRAMFLKFAAQAHSQASLTVRRGSAETQVNFVEQ